MNKDEIARKLPDGYRILVNELEIYWVQKRHYDRSFLGLFGIGPKYREWWSDVLDEDRHNAIERGFILGRVRRFKNPDDALDHAIKIAEREQREKDETQKRNNVRVFAEAGE